ncbi:MAG: calcium-binding protein [Thermodesulfobacteriota bacterium]
MDSTISNSTDSTGNTEVRTGHFEWADGTTGVVGEYRLQRDMGNTIAVEELEIPDDISVLPNLNGHGNVYDLRQAMVRDSSGELKALVEAFAQETNASNRSTIFDQIILRWTGADSVPPNARGPFMDARRIVALENFYGASWGNPDASLASVWQTTYKQIFEGYYGGLMSQTHLKDLYDMLSSSWDAETLTHHIEIGAVVDALEENLTNDPELGKQLLSEFARSLRGMGVLGQSDYLSFREPFIQQDPNLGWVIDSGGLPVYDQLGQGDGWWYPHMFGTWGSDAVKGSATEGDGYINGLTGDDVIYGTDRNEYLFNQAGDALLVGGGGNDQIWAGEGDDILDGGPGNDRLYGETGNDTYIFRRGSGQDIIIDPDATANNTDTIWLGSFLTPEEVVLRRSGNNLVLKIIDTTDTLTVQDYFRNDSPLNRIEQIQFMDGTLWTHDDILVEIVKPSEADDIFYSTSGNDELVGLGGNDSLYGLAGDDTLLGDAGNDKLYGMTEATYLRM